MGKKEFLWIAVEADEYELPIAIEDSAEKLGKIFGVSRSTITNCIKSKCDGTHSGRKYIKVRIREPKE